MDTNMEDVDKRVEWLHSEQYSVAGNVFGEPQKTTRIGDEYQARIPSLMTKNEQLHLIELPLFRDAKTDDHNPFGLPIPVTCGTNNNFLPVPCSSDEESWSVIEHDSFLLGLYIFGKNLDVVNKFVGNKGMPNILSYYYGKFYRNSKHQKWSKYLKKRSRKSIPGKRIFNGWRRHELLSRLLPNVTDECKSSLTQVVKTFEEGKLSLEKFVFTLRDTVGINLLIESIAIGKGKQDLVNKTKGMFKNNRNHSTCSSLKTEEIVSTLKGRIGLSKARLNELFWEVVWPRLLARGWHSEQPKNYALQNSKTSLVFLAPGVTKFSRRSLQKGSQYFDSFDEVLHKVASEPHLLEHEHDPDPLVEPHVKQGLNDEQDLIKYTIVDTSLIGLVKVRKLTSLSDFEPADMQASTSVSGDTKHFTAEKSQNKDSPVCEKVSSILDPDKIKDPSTDGRKLKFVFKRKTKRQQANDIRNSNTSDEDEAMKKALSEKKRTRIVIDLNSPRVGPGSGSGSGGDNSISSGKQTFVDEITTTNLLNAGQRQSTRPRALTTKALEALANGFLDTKKRRKGAEEDGTHRRVRGKTALVSRCGERYINNLGGGVSNGSSHMVSEYPK
ncbi:hypothetical protein SSX86_013091 [Deinandra increscens subsp. villosa]|uniref:SANT domain-containing protein n=1 Tax=Deinandra increscens subsp. villosa TaxID=3103831 RepID=A0AAP0D9U2_9ASTR